jgi:hypothetical protein
MPKLKLAIALPVIQVLLAVGLFTLGNHARGPKGWDTPPRSPLSLVCAGISAPAFPLIYVGQLLPTAWYPESVLGLGLPQVLFLPGVVAVWYWIGRWLERRRNPAAIERRVTGSKVFITFLQLMLGVFLFLAGFTVIRQAISLRASSNVWGHYVSGVLFLTWSLVLAISAMVILTERLGRRREFRAASSGKP